MQKPLCIECQQEADALNAMGCCSEKCETMFHSTVQSAIEHAMDEAISEAWMVAHFGAVPAGMRV
jgi:hypothetical protein